MSHDPTDLAGQEAQRVKVDEEAKLARRIEKEDTIWLMQSKRGRRIVYALLERAGVWRTSFNTNALVMAFNEGMRNEGLAMVAKLNDYCPDQYTQMLRERKDDE